LGKSVAEGLAKVKESDPTLQARSWATLARSSSRPKDQLVAYLRVLDTLEGR
jgi:sensor domain CHASE-containing protein